MKRIDLVFHDGGGGHRNAATALQTVIAQQGRPWEVRLFNLQEELDSLDVLRRLTGIRVQSFYNTMLRNGWTLGSTHLLRLLQLFIRLYHKEMLGALTRHWQESQADMVVSVVPHFNRVLCESLANAHPGRPFVTVLTDLADFPPRFWIERQKQYVICGTERAVEQAREMGHAADRIFLASGMILNPRFYEPVVLDPCAERRRLGLDPDRPTGVVLFGGYGSKVMLEIVERLDCSDLDLQLILICGRNQRLADELRRHKTRLPMFIEGFTSRVNEYMHLADFFMGKPGPGCISEALAMNLPVIVGCNAWTLPQERYNAAWIREKEVGLVVRSFRQVVPTVREFLDPGKLARFRANVAAHQNRAVFEIPGFLEEILEFGENVGPLSANAARTGARKASNS